MAATDGLKKRKASAPAPAASSTKKAKKTDPKTKTKTSVAAAPEKAAKPTAKATSKPVKKVVKVVEAPAQQVETDLARFDSASEAESEAEQDQTAALLAGFSSDSESDAEDNALAAVDGLQLPIPALPASAELDERIAEANSNGQAKKDAGVVYVSRIPHGFYEHQMLGYFSQFGDITRLRLSRNRKTGASKHYAFLEFAHMDVARIVAETMNNYLMFGHSLKVRVVEPERVHPELFKGANKRFRRVPWNRIERARLAKTDRKGWEKRVGKEERRRADKKRLLGELGYHFESPDLRAVDSVPIKEVATVEAATVEAATVEAATVEAATVKADQEIPKAIDEKPADEAVTVDELIGAGAAAAAPEPAKVASTKKTKAKVPAKAKKAKKVKA